MALRLQGAGSKRYVQGFAVRCHPEVLDEPLHWRKPRRVFVCSMGDLFHKDVPQQFRDRVFDMMQRCSRHRYQVLTKRSERMAGELYPQPPHIAIGVTVEDRERLGRLDHLRVIPAATRFVSFEPLLEDLGELDLQNIHWVIIGGESGNRARPMDPSWVRSIVRQCRTANVAVFVKQLSQTDSPRFRDLSSFPTDLQIQEYPEAMTWGDGPSTARSPGPSSPTIASIATTSGAGGISPSAMFAGCCSTRLRQTR
jgi:protein gp37